MAESKQNNKAPQKKVEIRLPLINKPGANQEEFYSHNFKNYIIRRGVTVEVDAGVAHDIEAQQKALDEALAYAESKVMPDNLK